MAAKKLKFEEEARHALREGVDVLAALKRMHMRVSP